MAIGLAFVGSVVGLLAGIVALLAGQSVLMAMGIYFGTSLAAVLATIGICAVRTALRPPPAEMSPEHPPSGKF